MYEQIKKCIYAIKGYIYVNPDWFLDVCYVAMFCILLGCINFTTDRYNNTVENSLQSSIESAAGAGESVDTASEQIGDAQANITRAGEAIDRLSDGINDSKTRAESSTDELSELTELARQCQERNQRIKSLLEQSEN